MSLSLHSLFLSIFFKKSYHYASPYAVKCVSVWVCFCMFMHACNWIRHILGALEPIALKWYLDLCKKVISCSYKWNKQG